MKDNIIEFRKTGKEPEVLTMEEEVRGQMAPHTLITLDLVLHKAPQDYHVIIAAIHKGLLETNGEFADEIALGAAVSHLMGALNGTRDSMTRNNNILRSIITRRFVLEPYDELLTYL